MGSRRKFGFLMLLTIILAVALVLLTKTDLISYTHIFVEGQGDECVENVIESFDSGNRVVFIERSDRDDFNHIVDRIFDSPELFWIDMKYNAMQIGNLSMIAVREKYENIENAQYDIDRVANAVIQTVVNENMSEYNKVLAIHDWLCMNITYAAAPDDSDQDIYGALVNKRARCAGYAKAFTYLLDKIGIKSEVISGDSIDKNGENVPHAWNLIYIDGEPYYFDVTWDDDDENGHSYDWFGITTDEFKLSHFPSVGYDWVETDATDACYYVKNNMYLDEYSYPKIVSLIIKQGKSFYVKCKDRTVLSETIAAFNDREQVQKIMKGAGINYIDQILYKENKNSNCLYVEIC